MIGDHTDWLMEEMEADENTSGVYTQVIRLLKTKHRFQVYRNADWDQCFYPTNGVTDMTAQIRGPDGAGLGSYWTIEGEIGDRFLVKFVRMQRKGQDVREITWEKVGFETVDMEELAKTAKWHLFGSFRDQRNHTGLVEMTRDEKGDYYGDILMAFHGNETFQIIKNCNFLCALHPKVDNGTMFDEDGELQGPGPDGTDKFWSVGTHPEDQCQRGMYARIHLDFSRGVPSRVWWEEHITEDSQRIYLGQGCWNTMDRHCRMLGFVPFNADTKKPAQMVGKPDFLTVPPGETKTDQKSIQGPGLIVGVNATDPLKTRIIG
jgi:hypothetical protein